MITRTSSGTRLSQSQVTGTKDRDYNLIWFLEHCLDNALRLETYIDDARHFHDWRASPLVAGDLSGLPPAFVLTAGYDPLRDEGRQYADALSAAGSRAQYVCFERQIHGFITMGRVIDEANLAVGLCALSLRRALA